MKRTNGAEHKNKNASGNTLIVKTSSMPSSFTAKHTPTVSMIESMAPTSWKCTCLCVVCFIIEPCSNSINETKQNKHSYRIYKSKSREQRNVFAPYISTSVLQRFVCKCT